MRQRLQGGRFRWLNETLYTTDGSEALRLMNDQPELMQQYHEGGRAGAGGWAWHVAARTAGPLCARVPAMGSRRRWAGLRPPLRGRHPRAELDWPPAPATAPAPAGFREQTKGWPVQPVDQAIRWLRGKPASWAVADLGCGDAKIAATVQQVRCGEGRAGVQGCCRRGEHWHL